MFSNNDVYEMEKILFWFYISQKQRSIGFCNKSTKVERDYSIDDVAILIKRLFLSGSLSRNHLDILNAVCSAGVIPDDRNEEERPRAVLWKELVGVVLERFLANGWLEKSSCKFA